jgi:hypothetical protein
VLRWQDVAALQHGRTITTVGHCLNRRGTNYGRKGPHYGGQ